MTEIDLLFLIHEDIRLLINISLLFGFLAVVRGIYAMWKGGMKNE